MDPAKLKSLPEIARAIDGVSYSTVWRAVQSGDLPSLRVGGRDLVTMEDAHQWARTRMQA